MQVLHVLRGAGIMADSVIEALWNFLCGCPLLKDYTMQVNFRSDDIDCAGIVEDSTEVLQTYLSGSELKAMHASLFLGSLSYEDFQRIQTSAFIDDLRRWFMNVQTLPQLPEYRTAQDIRMDGAVPFEYEKDGKKCTYQMSITLEYIEERNVC